METMAARIKNQISAFDSALLLLDSAKAVGIAIQAREGQLVQLLAQANRVKANRAGLAPWVATNLDVTEGKARAIAQAAKPSSLHVSADATAPETVPPRCGVQPKAFEFSTESYVLRIQAAAGRRSRGDPTSLLVMREPARRCSAGSQARVSMLELVW